MNTLLYLYFDVFNTLVDTHDEDTRILGFLDNLVYKEGKHRGIQSFLGNLVYNYYGERGIHSFLNNLIYKDGEHRGIHGFLHSFIQKYVKKGRLCRTSLWMKTLSWVKVV